ncbi:MAG: iron hydrogenase small subunit, partial [Clostridia bacterium]|nr:iron hydrogenase small subunit [Clostridia bacterium]
RVIVGTAPSVRVGLGEEFGLPIGTNVEGKMVTALRRIGFNDVFDVNFTADLTIMEEGTEFINRVTGKAHNNALPMITSCSPAWIKFCEHNFPEQLDHLSSCKSPQQMFGAVCKTYYAEKLGMDPKDIIVVSIMPCTAKKFEKGRADQSAAGVPDIDFALTTRELAKLIKRKGILFNELPDGEFDAPLGMASGAGLIFGATGGVMEAALRTVYEVLEKKDAPSLDWLEVRGTEGRKEATYTVAGQEVKVCVVSGLGNARKVMEEVAAGTSPYHFIEVMSCPGGCVNGGGQPIVDAFTRSNVDVQALRAKAIYDADKAMTLRKSHENPAIQNLYKEYFGEPGSHKAHDILHTKYVKRDRF